MEAFIDLVISSMHLYCYGRNFVLKALNPIRHLTLSTDATLSDGVKIIRKLSNKEFKKLSPEERHELALAKLKFKMNQKRLKKREAYAKLSSLEKEVVINQKYEMHRLSEERMQHALNSGIKVCVDMSLDHVHTDHDRSSLFTQLLFGYTFMKKCKHPIHLHFTSINTPKLIDGVNSRGYNNWYANILSKSPWEFFLETSIAPTLTSPVPFDGKTNNNPSHHPYPAPSAIVSIEDMIVLSPDATEVLHVIDPKKVSEKVYSTSVRVCIYMNVYM